MKKVLQVAFAIAIIAVATSCEEQVTLKEEENIPEIAEHLLGMTHEKAKQYLETQRFVLCEARESSHEYLYTRNFTDKQQTDEADEYLGYATIGTDTIRLVFARHRCQTQKNASDLYRKWSNYTWKVTFPTVEQWDGSITLYHFSDDPYKKDFFNSSYHEGTIIKEQLQQAEKDYKNGILSEEEYKGLVEELSSGRDRFNSDYQHAVDNNTLYEASEFYFNSEASGRPKETTLTLFMNNGGNIEVLYQTTGFVSHWK